MTATKDEIKKWLKDIGEDRFWLAEKCFVGKRTIDKWMEQDREIPAAKLALIISLMDQSKKDAMPSKQTGGRAISRNTLMTLQFTDDEWKDIMEYQGQHPEVNMIAMAEQLLLNYANEIEKKEIHDSHSSSFEPLPGDSPGK